MLRIGGRGKARLVSDGNKNEARFRGGVEQSKPGTLGDFKRFFKALKGVLTLPNVGERFKRNPKMLGFLRKEHQGRSRFRSVVGSVSCPTRYRLILYTSKYTEQKCR